MRRLAPSNILLALALAAGLPAAALAADPGEVLWSVETGFNFLVRPGVVAPDGTIYFHSEELLALTPAGDVLWREPLLGSSVVDRDDGGNLYAVSGNLVVAYRSDGVRLWTFDENPAAGDFMGGPNVGPDGNIYAVTDTRVEGLGAFSLTPAGVLRWNITGYEDHQPIGIIDRRLEFADDRFYFAYDRVPVCDGTGMTAILFDGTIDWCEELSGHSVVAVGVDGRAHISAQDLRTFDVEGNPVWTDSLIQPGEPTSGPDGSVYLTHDTYDLSAIRPDGSVRWTVDDAADGRFPMRPSVTPDGETVLLPTGLAFGQNGELRAFDAATGASLWTLPLTGPSAGAAGPALLSPNGAVAYLPVSTQSTTDIVAVQVDPAIFADGFESGDVTAWDAVLGG